MVSVFYDEDVATRNAAQYERDIAACEQVTLEALSSLGGPRRFRNSVYSLGSRLL
jgi:hypothetical protein